MDATVTITGTSVSAALGSVGTEQRTPVLTLEIVHQSLLSAIADLKITPTTSETLRDALVICLAKPIEPQLLTELKRSLANWSITKQLWT